MERKLLYIYLYVLIGFNTNASAQNLLIPQEYSIELEDSAEMGIPEAQYKIGKHYYQLYDMLIDGSTSKEEARSNRKIASEWFKKAVSKVM